MPKFGLSFFTPKGFSDEKVTIYSSIGATHKITPLPLHRSLNNPSTQGLLRLKPLLGQKEKLNSPRT